MHNVSRNRKEKIAYFLSKDADTIIQIDTTVYQVYT